MSRFHLFLVGFALFLIGLWGGLALASILTGFLCAAAILFTVSLVVGGILIMSLSFTMTQEVWEDFKQFFITGDTQDDDPTHS